MGTSYHITVIADYSKPVDTKYLQSHVEVLLKKINQQMSTYIESSEISAFNQFSNNEWFSISNEFATVVHQANKISDFTFGTFDITAKPLINLWGFGTKFKEKIPNNQQIKAVLPYIGYRLVDIRLHPPALRKHHSAVQIDLSAIAKGYAVDKISTLLLTRGFKNHLVEIGGEVISHGSNLENKAWRIAIQNPSSKNNATTKVLSLTNQAVATSGDYINYFEKSGIRYSHTIDPNAGKPITHKLASITVLGKSALRVDALATAIMVMGEVKGKKFILENNLKAFMIIRNENGSFSSWDNL